MSDGDDFKAVLLRLSRRANGDSVPRLLDEDEMFAALEAVTLERGLMPTYLSEGGVTRVVMTRQATPGSQALLEQRRAFIEARRQTVRGAA